MRTYLLRERESLAAATTGAASIAAGGVHSDAAGDDVDHDLALSLLAARQDALYEIEQAIRRIETGTYGTCEITGKRISRERLRAIPWTRYSVEAEEQLESDGLIRRIHLASAVHST